MTAWAADILRKAAEHNKELLEGRRYESDEARQLQAEMLVMLDAELMVLNRLREPPQHPRRRRRPPRL